MNQQLYNLLGYVYPKQKRSQINNSSSSGSMTLLGWFIEHIYIYLYASGTKLKSTKYTYIGVNITKNKNIYVHIHGYNIISIYIHKSNDNKWRELSWKRFVIRNKTGMWLDAAKISRLTKCQILVAFVQRCSKQMFLWSPQALFKVSQNMR